MEDYNVEGRLITKDDWEKWLKMKEEYSDRHLSNIPEPSAKKESRYAVIEWHKYPQEKPKECDEYLVTVNCGYFNLTETSTWKDGLFTNYENKPNRICSIIAWAEKPEPYKEEK